ncbi:hypothetical protein F4677DRAFT_418151 [Hypoxylon crocopeplum]|nr:hypothetical protein F4677DRAFT_418151 [Hypoxylon crocopeplum]
MQHPSRDQLLQTAKSFLESFNDFTPESVVRYSSPTCTYRILPAILKSPPQTNAELVCFIKELKAIAPAFELRLIDGEVPVIDVVTRKVVMHLKSRSETTVGLYENEYIWVLTLSEDGKSVDDLLEFVDSLYTQEWLPKLRKAGAEAVRS